MVNVTVRIFGPAVDVVGHDTLEYGLTPPAALGDLIVLLYAKYPKLADASDSLRFAINDEYADLTADLRDGDEIAIIPPVSGGSPLVELTREPIDLDRLIAHVTDGSCGGEVTFEGVVRAEGPPDNPLDALEYTAHETMAVDQLHRIREEAVERFDIRDVAIVHRIGRLEIGEASVAIAVAAPHRADAFEACRWVIDTLKLDVPIWKREIRKKGEAT
jgi:molybdopterin synthase catalytic subunit